MFLEKPVSFWSSYCSFKTKLLLSSVEFSGNNTICCDLLFTCRLFTIPKVDGAAVFNSWVCVLRAKRIEPFDVNMLLYNTSGKTPKQNLTVKCKVAEITNNEY